MLEWFTSFLSEEYEWVFSGIGVFIIGLILVRKAKAKTDSNIVNQENIEASGDVVGRDKNNGRQE